MRGGEAPRRRPRAAVRIDKRSANLLSIRREVKNAGMIRLRNGTIVELSNNSGHYKPGIDNIVRFIEYYRTTMNNSCYPKLYTCGDREWAGTLNDFVAHRQEVIDKLRV
jgi:hypothetical protein